MENNKQKETVSKELFIKAITKLNDKIVELENKKPEISLFLSNYTNKSKEIDEISSGLFSIQGELKDKNLESLIYQELVNYNFIDSMLIVLTPILLKAGITIIFNALHNPGTGRMFLEVILSHKSGQWISSLSEYFPDDKLGGGSDRDRDTSGLSHAMRIHLFAMLGIVKIKKKKQRNYS